MENLTNEFFITSYLDEVKKRSPGSFANNRLMIQNFTNYTKKPFLDVTMIDLQNYLINHIDKKSVKKSSKNTIRYMLKAFFNYIKKTLLMYNIDYNNPVPSKKLFKFTTNLDDIEHIEDAELKVLKIHQLQKILNYCKKTFGLRVFVMVGIAIFCGCRISEIRTIRKKDINLKECFFQTGFVPGSRKTTLHTNKGLLFFFPKVFAKFVQEYLESCDKCIEWVFPGYKDEPLSRAMVQDIVNTIRKGVTIHFTWHYFRKSRITEMTKMGCSLEIREMLMNHAPSSVEGKSYVKLSIKEKKKLYNKWDPYKKLWELYK